MKNYYDVLQVTRIADKEIIKAAYKKLAEKYHPDRNHSSDAMVRFQDIQEAFEVLGDFEKRAKYDRDYWGYIKEKHKGTTTEIPSNPKPKNPPKEDITNPNKNPFSAALLSLLLFGGGGQIYLGQVAKGVTLIILTLFGTFLLIGFLIPIVGCIDAYVMADKLQKGETIGQWQFFWKK
jgi:curved DNA-binding protein CbpA